MQYKKLLTVIGCVCFLFNIGIINAVAETTPITNTHDGLRVSIDTNKNSYYIGDEIKITVTLTNLTNRNLTINHNNGWWTDSVGSVTWLTPEGEKNVKEKEPLLGLISNSYKEGYWWLPEENIHFGTSYTQTTYIPKGKSARQNCLHVAKEPGNPVLIADFLSRRDIIDSSNVDKGNWFGHIVITKTIEVKNEIRPDILKILKESESIIKYSENPKRLDMALSNIYKIGYPAKDTLLMLIRNPKMKGKYCYNVPIYNDAIYNLSLLIGEAFDEEAYRELMKIVCDPEEQVKVRCMAMWWCQKSNPDVTVIIPLDFQKWFYQQIASLKNDKQKEVREKAISLLESNKDDLKRLGLDDLLK